MISGTGTTHFSQNLFTLILLFFACAVYAQSEESPITATNIEIGGQSYMAYRGTFNGTQKELELSFWKYSKTYGRLLNMKTYQQLTIPGDRTSNEIDIIILSKAAPRGKVIDFFLALELENIPEQKIQSYQDQTKGMLKDFKRYFLMGQLNEKIKSRESDLIKLSARYDKLTRKGIKSRETKQLLESIRMMGQEIEELKRQMIQL
ncbi:MAG: hypothetical protein KI790_06105 [Cyclobacteriaceae bacterium]|nr:hypothetical protein [Cyclobacteriaceae bacterium HetDA_MAG_MS6]